LCLWSYWKDHDEQDLMDLDSECGRYWFLKWFLPLKTQINSRKPSFEGKISWGHGNTLANGTGHISVY
jgi:hypothetical protein